MPIFEYHCEKCKNEFEVFLMDRNEKISCPRCGSKKARKKFSVFAHKSDSGFTPSSGGGSSCSGCSSSSCSGCSK